MEHDAFTSGVEMGGLLNSRDIRVLVCYMLNSVDEPMTRSDIVEIVFTKGMANFFETEAAIDELIRLGNLEEDEQEFLRLTEVGRDASQTLTSRLPLTIRERSAEACIRLLTRRRRERETRVDFEHLEEGGVAVTCSIDRSEHPMMSVTLRVADDAQAQLIRDRFLDDPVTVYRLFIGLLTGEAQKRTIGDHVFLDLPR
ncbi:MAG: DUF4364 family protein [Clostridia bacterium]|nr:DUF4364 family protein [Clostridia bacterium]